MTLEIDVMDAAEICAALQHYIKTGCKGAPRSRADALRMLREIDRQVRVGNGGVDELLPPDDLLAAGEGT